MYPTIPKVLNVRQSAAAAATAAGIASWEWFTTLGPYQINETSALTPAILVGWWVYWLVFEYSLFFAARSRSAFLHPPRHLYELPIPDVFEKVIDNLAQKAALNSDKWRKELVDQQGNRIVYSIQWTTEDSKKGRVFKNNLRLTVRMNESETGKTWVKFEWDPQSEYDINAADKLIFETQQELDEILNIGDFSEDERAAWSLPPMPPWTLIAVTVCCALFQWTRPLFR